MTKREAFIHAIHVNDPKRAANLLNAAFPGWADEKDIEGKQGRAMLDTVMEARYSLGAAL